MIPIPRTIWFESFGRTCSGRVVTGSNDSNVVLVWSRNPFGSHNLVAVSMVAGGCWEAYRHGDAASLAEAANFLPRRAYRKARKFLAQRGRATDWCVIDARTGGCLQ